MPGPDPEPFTCAFGFEVDAAAEECNCSEPKVRIGDAECRELEPGEFYSDMEGCLIDIGMIFYFEDDTIRNRCCRRIQMEAPSPTLSRTRYNPVSARITRLSDGTDSIWFTAGGGEYLVPDPTGGDVDLLTFFSGKFIDENTIVGDFQWGRPFDDGRIRASHPGVFRRRPE